MKKLITIFSVFLLSISAFAQLGVQDNFNYGATAGSLTTSSSGAWVAHSSSGTNPVLYSTTGLTYSGYPASGIGGAATLAHGGTREDINIASSPVTSGNVYTSFLLNVKLSGGTTGDYFLHLNDSQGSAIGSNFRGRFFVKDGSTGGKFLLGLTKGSAAASAAWTGDLDTGTTYLVVLKYVYISGTNNDSIFAYVFNGGVPAVEPVSPTLTATDITTLTDLVQIRSVCLRQGSTGTASHVVDGIRLGKTWSETVAGIQPPPGAPLTPVVSGVSQTSVSVNWTKPFGYIDSTMTTLVFLRPVNPITAGSPTKSSSVYTANTAYPLGTAYQNDTAAKCVFNADGNSVTVTGLSSNTVYHVLLYTVRTADSSYSTAVAASGSTFGVVAPPVAAKLSIKFNTPYNATVGLSKDSSYRDSTMTTLVFIKKGFSINAGSPSKGAGVYTANSAFPFGTGYENDTAAKCIYNGDSSKFDVTGLSPRTIYTLMSLVVRDKDSVYSSASIITDSSGSFTPPSLLGMKFSLPTISSLSLTWTKPAGYIDSTMQTLIFVKANNGIATNGYLSKDASLYIANSNFPSPSTPFPLDTLARCMYNGDSAKVTITGLQPGTNYYAAGYVVRKADSSYYSAFAITNFSTSAFPVALTGLTINGTSQTTAAVSWTKPASYDTLNNQMIVFVKAINPIGTAKPVKHPSTYTANPDFTLNGTKYENDTLAKCVYSGDGNNVTVTGLVQGTNYHVMAFNTRLNDSTWSSSTISNGATFGAILPPAPVATVGSNNTGSSSGVVSWSKDSSYNDSTMTILVFAKAIGTINGGTPVKPSSAYNADASFKGLGTRFELDTLAKCIYKGDGTKVGVVDLDSMTLYNFVVYVVRDKDSMWSAARNTSFGTQAPIPPAVLTAKIDGVTLASARISWTKPAGYDNAKLTTMVWLKENGPVINPGAPKGNANAFVASTIFKAGSLYQYDSNAYTIAKVDTNFVVVTNLKRGVNYNALILIVRDADSIWGAPATAIGNVLPPPPLYPIGAISKVNPTTGNPDSLNVKVRVRGVCYGYNQRATGLQFVARDGSGGITLFRSTGNFGYTTYAEGDSVEAEGSIATFRGLAELNLDTIIVLGNNRPLQNPKKVSIVEEAGENDLLRIDSVKFLTVPSGGVWPVASANYSVTTPRGDTIVIRVLSNCPLAGTPLPATPTFSVVGLGVQFSTSSAAPFLFNGYQLFPRSAADIIPVQPQDTLLPFNLTGPSNNTNITLTNDTSVKINFNWRRSISTVPGVFPLYTVLLDTIGGNFSSPRFAIPSNNSGLDTTISGPVAFIGAALGIAPGQTFRGVWTVVAQGGTFVRKADSVFRVTFNSPAGPLDTLTPFILLTPTNNGSINVEGDTANSVQFNWSSSKSNYVGITPTYILYMDTFGNSMASPKLIRTSSNGGLDTTVQVKLTELASVLGLNSPGMTYKANWGVEATGGAAKKRSANLNTITFVRGLFNGVNDKPELYTISLYPNPANDKLYINTGEHAVESAQLIDLSGRVISLPLEGKSGNYKADVSFCIPGVYILQLKYANIVTTHKVHISK